VIEAGAATSARRRAAATTVAICLGLLLLLQLCADLEVGGKDALPKPTEVLPALWRALGESTTWSALGKTMTAWAAGLSISIVLGVLLGIVLGSSALAYRSTRGVFDYFRSVPPIALIPLGVLILGATSTLEIVLVVVVCVWPVLIQTMTGVRDVDPAARQAGRSLRMSRWQTLRWILMPSTLPFVGTGVRLAAIMALMVCIGVELLAAVPGIGLEIVSRQSAGAFAELWAFIAIAAVLGILISQVFLWLEKRLMPWHPAHRGA
jgi:NitT/TauT family transport system permease protein